MKNIFLLFLLFSSLANGQNQTTTPLMTKFISEFDGMTFNQISDYLDTSIKEATLVLKYTNDDKTEPKNVAIEDEDYDELFHIDTSKVTIALNQYKDLTFSQVPNDSTSHVSLQNGIWNNTINLPQNNTQKFEVKNIYYKNGDVKKDNHEAYYCSFNFRMDWGYHKIIDSLSLDYTVDYLTAYDSVTLSAQNDKVSYKNGTIKIAKIDHNYVSFVMSDFLNTLDYHYVAFNKNGKPLSRSTRSGSSIHPNKIKKSLSEVVTFLEKAKNKITKEAFDNPEAFQSYLKRKIVGLDYFRNQNKNYYLDLFFRGNIDKITFYFETNRNSITKSFIAKNDQIDNQLFPIEKNGKTIFLDENLVEVFKSDIISLERFNKNYYYTRPTIYDAPSYYHLNSVEKKLTPIAAKTILQLDNGLLAIKNKDAEGFVIYNNDHKIALHKTFKFLESLDSKNAIAVDLDGNYYLVDTKVNTKLLKNIVALGDTAENLIPAENKASKSGYLDMNGDIAIPFRYNWTKKFSEGLAAVSNDNNLFGYIDTNGKQILPFTYHSAKQFVNGLTMVEVNGTRQIIDVSGKVITISDSPYGQFSMHEDGLNTIYTMGSKKYDAFGKLIIEE